MLHHTLVIKENCQHHLMFEQTWRAFFGSRRRFRYPLWGMSFCLNVISINPSFVTRQKVFLKSFVRRLLDGEVLDWWQHVTPSARQSAAAERILLRRDACLALLLKWYDTTLLIFHIRLPPPALLTVDLNGWQLELAQWNRRQLRLKGAPNMDGLRSMFDRPWIFCTTRRLSYDSQFQHQTLFATSEVSVKGFPI
jgi:hypothetical protein